MHRLPPVHILVLLLLAAAAFAPALSAQTEIVNWTSGVSYTYDGAGDPSRIGNDEFVYDDVGRLVQAQVNGAKRDYRYDAYGNRTHCAHDPSTDCQFDRTINPSNNRLQPASYDTAGNLTVLGTHTYSYDALNVMTSDNTSQFIYNARDERIATYDSGTWRWTLRDGNAKVLRVFTSRDGSSGVGREGWTWVKDYVWRNDMLLASRQREGTTVSTYHYHLDHLGTPRRITDDKETIVGFHDYYAFGPEVSTGLIEKSRAELRYTAHERDDHGEEFSLDYMHARYYNPAHAKFLSVDPARASTPGDPQTWNRYTYARNSPLRLVDPNGLQSMDHKVLHVHVNLVFSNADTRAPWGGSTLRQQAERGMILTRQYFNQMGIAVTFHRYEGTDIDLSTYDKKATNVDLIGKVQTANGEMTPLDFARTNYGRALTVFVAGKISLGNDSHGGTQFFRGTQLLSILPALASAKTLPHEIAHALGNTLGNPDNPALGANTATDFIWFMERQQFNMGIGFSMEFERWIREGAEKLDQ